MDDLTTSFEECKKILEDFLLKEENLPICSKSFIADIDSRVSDYLVKKGYDKFLAYDVSFGPQVGGISEGVLCEFVRTKRVFDGKSGRFKIEARYGPMSVRYFQAWPVQ